jgi:hypothetical protein
MENGKQYASLHEWMDDTGTNQQRLIALVHEKTGHRISPAMMSMILRGSRRCSRFNAFALFVTTGVPMKTLTRWPQLSRADQDSGDSPKVA